MMSSLENLTIIASSNEFCASCGGANCGGASPSSFTCLQNLDMRDKPQDKAAESEPKHVTRVKKYIGEVDLPESKYLDFSSHSSHVSFAMARRYGAPPTGKQTPFRALPHPVP